MTSDSSREKAVVARRRIARDALLRWRKDVVLLTRSFLLSVETCTQHPVCKPRVLSFPDRRSSKNLSRRIHRMGDLGQMREEREVCILFKMHKKYYSRTCSLIAPRARPHRQHAVSIVASRKSLVASRATQVCHSHRGGTQYDENVFTTY